MTTTYTPMPPVRALDQRMASLKFANEIRFARSDLKRRLRVGAADPAEILRDPPGYVLSMKVFDLLVAIPKLGPVKAQKLMRALSISATKTVAGMSDRQRDAIARDLEGR